jgi:hypothetical protein
MSRHLATFDAVLNALGGLRGLSDLLGVTKSAVSKRRCGGKFPARWFACIDEEVHRRGMTVARSVFDFSVPHALSNEPLESAIESRRSITP